MARTIGEPCAWLRAPLRDTMHDMLTRADDLATMTVLDENGNAVVLGDLWRDRTAVLVFTRHFG